MSYRKDPAVSALYAKVGRVEGPTFVTRESSHSYGPDKERFQPSWHINSTAVTVGVSFLVTLPIIAFQRFHVKWS